MSALGPIQWLAIGFLAWFATALLCAIWLGGHLKRIGEAEEREGRDA